MIEDLSKFVTVSAISIIVGFVAGYGYASDQNDIDRLNAEKQALIHERDNLYEQIGVEHDRQEKIRRVETRTREDLSELERRYHDAVAELDALQLSIAENRDNASALSNDSKTAGTVSQSRCDCGRKDQRALQRLLDEQLTLARDCDINASYLNSLIDLYNSISE